MTETDSSETERRVLAYMKDILTRVARETATPRGTRHVLSEETIERIRGCLALISAREMELSGKGGELTPDRPRYPGQASRRDKVAVSLNSIVAQGDDDNTH
jgi:hypothetical protein